MADSLPAPEEERELREVRKAFEATKPEELRQIYEGLSSLKPYFPPICAVPGLARLIANAAPPSPAQAESPVVIKDWEFETGVFRYRGSKWHPLSPISLMLLTAFTKTSAMTLTRDQIENLTKPKCSLPSVHARLHQLRHALQKLLKLNFDYPNTWPSSAKRMRLLARLRLSLRNMAYHCIRMARGYGFVCEEAAPAKCFDIMAMPGH
jgi:hypothetical protein